MDKRKKTKRTRYHAFFLIVLTVLITGCSPGKADLNQASEERVYVVNIRSGKIHSPSCSYVEKMSDKNKKVVSDTLCSLLGQDYLICRRCKAGVEKEGVTGLYDKIRYPNLYIDDVEVVASYEDYLNAINEMSHWYVDHVPTYASSIQDEPYSNYHGELKHYNVYSMTNKGTTARHIALSRDVDAKQTSSLKQNSRILRADENAAINYMDQFTNIDFRRHIAYYPCNLLDSAQDYNTPGDDCVRYMFAIFNLMDPSFTEKYSRLSNKTFSNTNSKILTEDKMNIAYGFINLGFKVYDVREYAVDVDKDNNPEGLIFKIDNDFRLREGDILARRGHVHIYLGDGMVVEAPNFGWGRVYREYPQVYSIGVESIEGQNYIYLVNSAGEKELYTRVYRYIGKQE